MNKAEMYAVWAPDSSLWSPWTKPVLFAYLDAMAAASELPAASANLDWCPPAKDKVVVVVDLAGAESVLMGVALAERGYRPVPLYNAVPLPSGYPVLDPATGRNVAAVDVLPIISSLRRGAERLANLQISTDAPPVFLLDDNRQGDGRTMMEDEFDNRSVCFTTDFPSANFLLGHGFQQALIVQKSALNVRS